MTIECELHKHKYLTARFLFGTWYFVKLNKVDENGIRHGFFMKDHRCLIRRYYADRKSWLLSLSIIELQALQLYYFDQFNFEDGSDDIKKYLEAIEVVFHHRSNNIPMKDEYFPDEEFIMGPLIYFRWYMIPMDIIVYSTVLLFYPLMWFLDEDRPINQTFFESIKEGLASPMFKKWVRNLYTRK